MRRSIQYVISEMDVEDEEDPSDQSTRLEAQTGRLLPHEESGQTFTIDDAVNTLGMGRTQMLAAVYSYSVWMYVGIRIVWIALLTSYSRCSFNITGWQLALSAQCFYVGRLSSGLASGLLIDRFGRKKIATIFSLFSGYFQLLLSLAPTYSWLVLLSFILGFTYGPLPSASLAYCAELQPSRFRKGITGSLQTALFFGGIFTILFCILAANQGWSWRIANALSTLSILPIAVISMYVPESPHYDISQGKNAEVVKLLKHVAAENQAQLPQGRLVQSGKVTKQIRQDGTGSWAFLWTPRIMLFLTIANVLARCTLSFSYHGYYFLTVVITQFWNKEVSKCPPFETSDFLNLIWSLSSEVFSGLAAGAALMFFKQRIIFLIFGVGSCLPLAVLLLPTTTFTEVQMMALIFTGRTFSNALNQASYVVLTELFPSVARGKAFGLFVVTSSIGYLMAPYIGGVLSTENLFAAKVVFLASACISTISVVSLPDVSSKKLENALFTTDGRRA